MIVTEGAEIRFDNDTKLLDTITDGGGNSETIVTSDINVNNNGLLDVVEQLM